MYDIAVDIYIYLYIHLIFVALSCNPMKKLTRNKGSEISCMLPVIVLCCVPVLT